MHVLPQHLGMSGALPVVPLSLQGDAKSLAVFCAQGADRSTAQKDDRLAGRPHLRKPTRRMAKIYIYLQIYKRRYILTYLSYDLLMFIELFTSAGHCEGSGQSLAQPDVSKRLCRGDDRMYVGVRS